MRQQGLCGIAIALGTLSSLVACAPESAIGASRSPLRLDFTWPPSHAPSLRFWPQAPPSPQAVTIRWNPNDYSYNEIKQIAGQQCLTFGRVEVAAGAEIDRNGMSTQRFDCAIAKADASAKRQG